MGFGPTHCRGGVYPRPHSRVVAGFRSGHPPSRERFGATSKARIYILLATFLTACGSAQIVPPEPRGALRIEGNPKDAHLEIDEVHLGPVDMFEEKGVLLRPGRHRIIVRADGYFPEYRIIEIKEDEVQLLKIDLRPVPP